MHDHRHHGDSRGAHAHHDKHAGHTPEMFRNRLLVSLLLTLPILYRIGRPEWATELGLAIPEALATGLREAESRGESVIVLMEERKVVALVALADRVRESARQAVQALQGMGVETVMITGDAEAVAKTVAQELGITRFFARVLPQDKSRIVGELKRTGPVAFVGD